MLGSRSDAAGDGRGLAVAALWIAGRDPTIHNVTFKKPTQRLEGENAWMLHLAGPQCKSGRLENVRLALSDSPEPGLTARGGRVSAARRPVVRISAPPPR